MCSENTKHVCENNRVLDYLHYLFMYKITLVSFSESYKLHNHGDKLVRLDILFYCVDYNFHLACCKLYNVQRFVT